MPRLVLAALFAIVLTLVTRDASANAAAPYRRNPGAAGGAFTAGETSLVVDHETLTIDCEGGSGDESTCKFEAIYEVSNPTDAAEEVLGAFFGARHDEMTITVEGGDVRRALSTEQVAAALASVPSVGDADRRSSSATEMPLAGFVVRVPAREKRTVRFAGKLAPTYVYHRRGGYDLPALKARHVLLGDTPREGIRVEYTYLVSPLRTWRGRPNIDITVRAPAAWRFSSTNPRWTTSREDGRSVSKIATNAEETPKLIYGFDIPPALLFMGGPFVGIGPELEEAGPRFRAGAEIGIRDWMIASLAYEAFEDKRRSNYTIVPAVEVASPNFIVFIPSLSAGVGVPVQLHSRGAPSVGARVQLGMAFPLVSIFVPLDVYFDDGVRGQLAFMTQLGF